jgi:hypothetical protein
MKSFRVLVLFFGLVNLFSCKSEKKCPAFNPSDLQYIAYNQFDTLTFVNQQNDSLFIYLQNFNLSPTFSQRCDFMQFVCPCINFVEVLAKNSASGFTYVFLRMEQSDASDMRYHKYRVLDFDFELDFENELIYADDFPYLDVYETFSIRDVVYYKVAAYTDLENASAQLSTVYLNKANGIIRILTKENVIWDRVP